MRPLLATLVLLACATAQGANAPPASAPTGQVARVSRAADLRDAPSNDGKLVRVLKAETSVTVFERRGGWYHVRVDQGDGWLRLTSVRFTVATTDQSSGGLSTPLRFLQSGRSAVTSGTVTTGVRGLSEEDLANAVPNPGAVDALDAVAVSADEARRYAAELRLVPATVAYIKPPKGKDKDGGD